jgi:beta-phosphoglucomutase-like phosphatase (HAD superfamily)
LVELALAAETASCLMIEDSNTGAKSAEAAGCTVLVVPNRVAVLDGLRRVFFDGSREHPEARYFNV